MKTITVTKEEIEEFQLFTGDENWTGAYAFSTNSKGAIWPKAVFGLTPEDQRQHCQGRSKLLDRVALEYLKVRDTGGRFFLQRDGAWYQAQDCSFVHFLAFTVK